METVLKSDMSSSLLLKPFIPAQFLISIFLSDQFFIVFFPLPLSPLMPTLAITTLLSVTVSPFPFLLHPSTPLLPTPAWSKQKAYSECRPQTALSLTKKSFFFFFNLTFNLLHYYSAVELNCSESLGPIQRSVTQFSFLDKDFMAESKSQSQ